MVNILTSWDPVFGHLRPVATQVRYSTNLAKITGYRCKCVTKY